MNLDVVIFIVSALVAVFGATMVIAQRNPVASVLYLILSLVAQAVCYVQLGALFMGAILIIVYAGAIMVLFLFVIMLLNLRGNDDLGNPPQPVGRFTRILFGVLLTLELASLIKAVPLSQVATGIMDVPPSDFGSVRTVATLLFTDYLYAFELTGVLLLAAVVGAVVVARSDKSEQPPSDSGNSPTGQSGDGKVV
jgi:NADH-quinone oxidoreductase subunit J